MNDQTFPNPFKTELPADAPLIIMSRVFDAPLDLVWTVWTKREHIAYWWGPHETNEVMEYDVRTDGKWRIASTMPDGAVLTFYGTYLAVAPKGLIRNTFAIEGMYEEDPRYYEEHHFEAVGGVTRYRSISNFPDIASRDAIVATGMEWGANASMVKVDEILERLKAGK